MLIQAKNRITFNIYMGLLLMNTCKEESDDMWANGLLVIYGNIVVVTVDNIILLNSENEVFDSKEVRTEQRSWR